MEEVKLLGMTLALFLVWVLFTAEQAAPLPDGFSPWPNHIEWSQYTVTDPNVILCRPGTQPDSTGDNSVECLHLPPGTEVYIPRVVPGRSQEEEQSRKWYTSQR